MTSLREALVPLGFVVLPRGAGPPVEEAARAPWAFAEALLGERARMVERQPIRAVPEGTTFASSSAMTPLHSDGQLFGGTTPDVQIMACVRPAEQGGKSLLLDTWRLLDELDREEPELSRDLFEVPRCIPFFFGDVLGPTVSLRRGGLTFTHAPVKIRGGVVGDRLRHAIAKRAPIELLVEAGEILIAHNHRLLHGRLAFSGGAREFTRLLVWLERPLAAPWRFTVRARDVPFTPREHGAGAIDPARRLRVVLEMIRGAPPGMLSARERIAERDLYALRDEVVATGLDPREVALSPAR